MRSNQQQIVRLKKDIELLHKKNKNEFNYIYEDNHMASYQRKSNLNTIYSINNNPIIYQKIVNTSFNTNDNDNKTLPLSLIIQYQNSIAHSSKGNNKRIGKSNEIFKAPFKQGIFSYKRKKEFINEKKTVGKNQSKNSTVLSQDLKLNFEEGDSISVHDSGRKNSSMINLNKYKISADSSTIKETKKLYHNLSDSDGIVMKNKPVVDVKKTYSNNDLRQFKMTNINDISSIKKPINENVPTIHLNNITNNYDSPELQSKRENQRMVIEYRKVNHLKANPSISNISSTNQYSPFISNSNIRHVINSNISQQYSNFISEMTENNKQKINLITFLTTPRIMNMITNSNTPHPFIFFVSPNTSCYLLGTESYVFRWIELNNKIQYGNFDIIKMISCQLSKESRTIFEISIKGKEKEEKYTIEASSREMCDNYIKCLNYLNQLIKCQVYTQYMSK